MVRVTFRDWLEEELKDAEFRAEYERLEPGFEVAKLRTLRGLTQEELAQRVGTQQSSISRLESGQTEPSVSFLRRVVEALDGQLEIHAVPREHAVVVEQEEMSADSGTLDVRPGVDKDRCIAVDWTDWQVFGGTPTPTRERVPA
jgi:transcriptional regulator with XRE-family HTH domain